MPSRIILIGKEQNHFHFIKEVLRKNNCALEFVHFDDIVISLDEFSNSQLFILDTVSFPENAFNQFYVIREKSSLLHIPILALVNEKPPRLRYRLVNMGIDDYLIVPFDRIDLQIRCRNILQLNGHHKHDKSLNLSSKPAIKALQSLDSLYRGMYQSIFNLKKDNFLGVVLDTLGKLCKVQSCILFEVVEIDRLVLQCSNPEGWSNIDLHMDISEIPILLKAVRFGEPTVLNNIKPENPFSTFFSSYLNIKVKSAIIFPININRTTRSVLCALKLDQEKFTEFDYLLVQNFSHFIIHTYYLNSLRKAVDGPKDKKTWQFYFEFLDQIVNQLSFGILVIGEDRKIKYLNQGAANLLSVSSNDVLRKPVKDILSENNIRRILNSVKESPFSLERSELELKNPKGKRMSVGFTVREFKDKTGADHGYIVSLKDITYNKEIQEEMRRVDRLASLGVMASGIAHEIRNPLAGIKAMAQTFEEELSENDSKIEYPKRIIRLVNRLDDLLRTLFSYAKPSKPNRQYCNVEELLSEVTSLLKQKFIEHKIKFSKLVDPVLPKVFVDPVQIQQVLVNLLLNSIEAIHKNGVITISIKSVTEQDPANDSIINRYLALGKIDALIEIIIKDNGCGINSENLKHIYNPFFTTKSFGTGLGLSIVYQIVKENNGIIKYESEVDRGTECYLYLPAKKF